MGRRIRDARRGEYLLSQPGQWLSDRGLGRERLSKLDVVAQLEQECAAGGLSIRPSCHMREDVRDYVGRLVAMERCGDLDIVDVRMRLIGKTGDHECQKIATGTGVVGGRPRGSPASASTCR